MYGVFLLEHRFPRYNGVPRVTPTDQPSKQEAFLTFLQDGWVTIYVDARRPGVAVPPHLKTESRLVLQYGLNMPVPVEDLEVTEGGVKATLSFSRQPYSTLIPWTAIYVIACTDGRGVLYKEDVPDELISEHTETATPAQGDDDIPADKPRPPAALSGARGQAATARAFAPTDDEGDDSAQPAAKPEPRRRLKSVPMPEASEPPASAAAAPEASSPTSPAAPPAPWRALKRQTQGPAAASPGEVGGWP